MVQTTKQERKLPEEVFTEILRETYPDYLDDTLKITQVTKRGKLAHLRTYTWKSKVILGINFREWRDMDYASRLSLLLHEVTHINEKNHKPSFWDELAENYLRVKDNSQIEHLMEFSDWREVGEEIVFDANSASVDLRMLNQQEARMMIRDKLGVQVNIWRDLEPTSSLTHNAQKVRISDVDVKKTYSEEELAEHWSEWHHKTGFDTWSPPYTPSVKTIQGRIEPAGISEKYIDDIEKTIAIFKKMDVEEAQMVFDRDSESELVTRTEIENGWD